MSINDFMNTDIEIVMFGPEAQMFGPEAQKIGLSDGVCVCVRVCVCACTFPTLATQPWTQDDFFLCSSLHSLESSGQTSEPPGQT